MDNTREVRPGLIRESKLPAVAPAGLRGILETSVYVDDLEEADRFYGGVLGLTKIFAVPERQLVFRCGEGVLLVFNPERSRTERVVIDGGVIPTHGASGVAHVAFVASEQKLEEWRERFRVAEVEIESEITWSNGAHSLYFRDPAGNSLELATPNLWDIMPPPTGP
jgi:catechol 2,3-dioxygenase-like lactoylglutathione lyase family enzyme